MSAAHRAEAQELAKAYVEGDDRTRTDVADACEQSGVLAALVMVALADAVREDFIRTMIKAVSE